MSEVHPQSQAIGGFLEWLQNEKEYELAYYHDHSESCYEGDGEDQTRVCGIRRGELLSVNYSIEKLLAEYFEIDLGKAEDERRAILESLR